MDCEGNKMPELKFINVGNGCFVCANRVTSMILPYNTGGRRFLKRAKDTDTFIDTTSNKPLRTLLLMDDGSVLGSSISGKALARRCNPKITKNDIEEEEEPDEDHRPECEDSEADVT